MSIEQACVDRTVERAYSRIMPPTVADVLRINRELAQLVGTLLQELYDHNILPQEAVLRVIEDYDCLGSLPPYMRRNPGGN